VRRAKARHFIDINSNSDSEKKHSGFAPFTIEVLLAGASSSSRSDKEIRHE